jgi:hypothetical protein
LVDNSGKVPDSIVLNNYCDDILTHRILNFIDSNTSAPFFIYYSMSVAHQPFSPTPTDSAYEGWPGHSNISDTSFFSSMISRMDYEVGLIKEKLIKTGLDKNTIIIFAGDNGTPDQISYDVNSLTVDGQKAHTTEKGTHVPLIAYWPSHIPQSRINDDLIDFTDFFPTFAEIAGKKDLLQYGIIDGLSFYSRMLGVEDASKSELFFHYDAHPGYDSLKRWVRDKTYKLYDGINGKPYLFYNIKNDEEEKRPLSDDKLTTKQKAIKARFKFLLDNMPTWPDAPILKNQFVKNITASSATIGATIINEGATPLIDRGSNLLVGVNAFCLLGYQRMHDAVVDAGAFSEERINLKSQTRYSYALYAMNGNVSHSTGYASGTFYTLSKPPLSQPSYFTACADTASIVLNWSKAKFPSGGATEGGYAIFYSTDSIELVDNPNGLNRSKIAKNANILSLAAKPIREISDSAFVISGLEKNIKYYFLIIPYTWDGKKNQTYNYLTSNALSAAAIISANLFDIKVSKKDPLCFNAANGSITASVLNSTQPYWFALNNNNYITDSTFLHLKAGSYLVTVKDNNGCIDSQRVNLINPTSLQLNATGVSAICYGDTAFIIASSNNGTAPYQYALNNNSYAKDSVFTNLSKSSYTLKVKDANGCVDSETVVLTPPEQLKLGLSEKDADCEPDGQIIASASKGVPPYLFSFNNGEFDTVHQFTNLAKGDYTIKAKDGNKCTTSGDVIVKAIQNCFTDIIISPNPTNSEFKLRIGNDQLLNHIVIRVYDVKGKLVYSNHGSNIKSYSFGKNFMAGVYFVKVESDSNKYNFKIIKE